MSFAKLIFKLPEEREDFELAMNAAKYRCALENLDNWLRALHKYENKEVVFILEVRQKLLEELGEVIL